jgi:endonuclease G, mitochondrial
LWLKIDKIICTMKQNIVFTMLFALLFGAASCDLLLEDSSKINNPYNNNTNTNTNTTTASSKINLNHRQSANCQLVKYNFFTISYSSKYKNPEWASYTLTADMVKISVAERNSSFRQDKAVAGCAVTGDYTNSGYDRGHLVPAEDMNFDETAMYESFFMTNVSPQDPTLNRGIWKSLEDKVRKWATANKKIHVVVGAILPKRNSATLEYIGANEDVLVPKKFFKIILDDTEPSRKAIAFMFDNEESSKTLKQHACTIDEVEAATGLDFFPNMSAADEKLLEATLDPAAWGDW